MLNSFDGGAILLEFKHQKKKCIILVALTKQLNMKKLLLFFAATIFTVATASAQCTPDPQYTSPGVYPDSATGFASAMVGVPYDQLITNVVPVDTTVLVGGFPITLTFDSVVIVSMSGLPPGYTYSCYDAQNTVSPFDGCAFEGNTIGCVSVAGTSSPGDEGTYNLNIAVEAYLEGGTTPAATYDIDYYKIVVQPAAGVEEYANSSFTLFPNPTSESFTLKGLNGLDISSVSILNAEGKRLKSLSAVHSNSLNLNVEDLENGIYFVQVRYNDKMEVIRFVKQ